MNSHVVVSDKMGVNSPYIISEGNESKEEIQAKIEEEIKGIKDPLLLKKVMALLQEAIKSDMSKSRPNSSTDPKDVVRLETEVLRSLEILNSSEDKDKLWL